MYMYYFHVDVVLLTGQNNTHTIITGSITKILHFRFKLKLLIKHTLLPTNILQMSLKALSQPGFGLSFTKENETFTSLKLFFQINIHKRQWQAHYIHAERKQNKVLYLPSLAC